MTITLRHALALALAACLALHTASLVAGDGLAPKELTALFAQYDHEADGSAKEALAAQIDALSRQKYAAVSRLYWHTDLASARTVAQSQSRPILHLRLLGRLDEELSCTNSRLFRTTLYANQDVSAFLRENFVLYWSSERPVPRVTIDFGDGRRIERTTTGNSAHYVLDEHGNVLDVLPGLYAPTAFRRELERSLALAARVRGTSAVERAKLLADYHQQLVTAATRDWHRIAGTPWIPGTRQLLTRAQVDNELIAAQRRALTKMSVERVDLRYLTKELPPQSVADDQIEAWAAAGQALYGIGDLQRGGLPPVRAVPRREPSRERFQLPTPPSVLDAASRALILRLHDALPEELRGTDAQRDAMIARLEQTLVADTALNQLRLRPQIGREILRRGGRVDFDTLNAWIYAEVFRTPKTDPWLGLLPRDTFTALPGDGVVMR